jgi:protein-tyrosine phosphatase
MHAHLLPGIDDGSRSVAESVTIAQRLVERGYETLVCTPHIWTDLPGNSLATVAPRVATLQAELQRANVPLKLLPGGEIALRPDLVNLRPDALPTYANRGRVFLVDTWVFDWPDWLTPTLRHLQQGGRTVVFAHPERTGMIQENPDNAKKLRDLGVLLQGNMYCLTDPVGEPTRELFESFLDDGLYYMLAGDLHREDSMAKRLRGLDKVTDRIGTDAVHTLLRDNPAKLLT